MRGRWLAIQNALTLSALALAPLFPHDPAWHPFLPLFGLSLAALSAALGLAGLRALGANRTPSPDPKPGATLVRTGIYAWIRHPLYASLIGIACGWALLWSSLPALAVTLALALFLDRKARVEEHALRHRFTDYAAYARQVRRFMPGVY